MLLIVTTNIQNVHLALCRGANIPINTFIKVAGAELHSRLHISQSQNFALWCIFLPPGGVVVEEDEDEDKQLPTRQPPPTPQEDIPQQADDSSEDSHYQIVVSSLCDLS